MMHDVPLGWFPVEDKYARRATALNDVMNPCDVASQEAFPTSVGSNDQVQMLYVRHWY
jgi:hypothetical protein